MPTPLGIPTWDEIDQQRDLIDRHLADFAPNQFKGGHLAKRPDLLARFACLSDAPEWLLAEYVKSFDRRLNSKSHTRTLFPVHALGDDTDNGDGNGVLFAFDPV